MVVICQVHLFRNYIPTVSKLKTINLVSILVSFIFLLFSLSFYSEVEDKEDKVGYHYRSHDTVTEVTHSCNAKRMM